MYSIKKVSELTDIPIVTIRAWEKRYQIVTPLRTGGGHRLYSETDIETLKWIKDQMERNQLKISEAVFQLKNKSGEALADTGSQSESGSGSSYPDLGERLYRELTALDSAQAHRTIDLAFSLNDFEDVFHRLLAPVLYRIGDAWESGLITVAQEHFASQLVMERFNQFHRILPVQAHLPLAMAFCPEGEHHHMGLMLFSLFMRRKGLDVVYLGPNTPLAGLTRLIKMRRVSIVAASVSDPPLLAALETWIETCRTEHPGLAFVLGGQAFRDCPPSLADYARSGDPAEWEAWFRSTVLPLRYRDLGM
ncbi:MerR family transcriptional regulator [Paenibacillus methanolicus]|uniref:B12 binding protein n=1 Tax=Paenibacillus methanolicus TaxID=582686 RepID=A0A5S5C3K2_9BACL|nr:MerR family transcriptional regulator [Paenibacillus methanolicus]TYP73198.1 B12 binding protein [Paenibacillus methanolicus]